MTKIVFYVAALAVFIHGLIHLMGFSAYLQFAEIEELPFKTTVFNGRWDLGENGIRVFGVLWMVVAVGYVIGVGGLVTEQSWWLYVTLAATIVSIMLTIMDWEVAFRGTIISIIILLVLSVVWGLRMKPASFPAYAAQPPSFTTVALPESVPEPVTRFYQLTIGDEIPIIDSAVVTASADIRFMGITFNSRMRFIHDAGQGYRHYIESTIFGYPILKVNETYLDGKGKLELPFGVVEDEPKIDSAANLGLWGESVWLPSIFITDERVRWEAIDETTARLIVPYQDGEDEFAVAFDAETGLLVQMEAMRWRDASDTEKIRWILKVEGWQEFHGIMVPSPATVTWEDEGTPWLTVYLEDVAYNIDVSEYIRASGL